jgi:adenosylcobyric acid synthase
LYLDAEDALTANERNQAAQVRVAALALPRISNHTDMDAPRLHPEVDFQWVGPGQPVPACDLLIIPGSKNVRADLQFLREQGWEGEIKKHLRYGGKLIGICGGFQMLGQSIRDPLGIEGAPGDTTGLGHLELFTELQPNKILRQQQALLWDQTTPVIGYEIHCGVSCGAALLRPFSYIGQEQPEGARSADNHIIGSYLHGLFDHPESLAAILNWCNGKDLVMHDINEVREQQLERLAEAVEQALGGKLDWLYSQNEIFF